LVRALGDSDWQVRYAAAQALGQLGERAPIDPLVRALGDSDANVRRAAAQALGQLGERAPIDPLVRALGDSNPDVRQAAAQALQQIAPQRLEVIALEGEEILVNGKSGATLGSLVQGNIAEILEGAGQPFPAFIALLTTLLDWPYWEVRMKAIHALGKIRRQIPEATVQKLEALRKDPESQAVCDAADDALAEILTLDENVIEDDPN
jgi:HEAT repeat protein